MNINKFVRVTINLLVTINRLKKQVAPGTVKRSEISGFSLAMFFDEKQEMAMRIAQSIKIIKACYNMIILLKVYNLSKSKEFIYKLTFYGVEF